MKKVKVSNKLSCFDVLIFLMPLLGRCRKCYVCYIFVIIFIDMYLFYMQET